MSQTKVKEIFEEERDKGIIGYDNFKIGCVDTATKVGKNKAKIQKGEGTNSKGTQ